jgi:hypothetical protein
MDSFKFNNYNMDKKCKSCGLTKSINEFFTASKYKDKQYYRGECKECTKLELRSETGKKAQEKYRKSIHGHTMKYTYKKRKRETDPFYKLKENVRRRLRASLDGRKWRKISSFNEYIGCTQDDLIKHIESKFTEGMSWEVFLTTDKIHIDHIIPLSSAISVEDIFKLCHYTNLQPLWAIDNIIKSNKLPK